MDKLNIWSVTFSLRGIMRYIYHTERVCHKFYAKTLRGLKFKNGFTYKTGMMMGAYNLQIFTEMAPI